MAGKTYVITSGKGGVGKTTTTANLGAGLALRGHKVAVVDTDIGLRNLDVVMGLENRIVYDLVDVVEGRCRLPQAMIRDKYVKDLCLIPAAQTRDKSALKPEQMKELCDQLREEFDYILIDCPAGIEQGFQNAIAAADNAIVVTTPEVSAIRDADRVIGLLEAAEIPTPSLVINKLKPGMIKQGDMMAQGDILELLSVTMLGLVPDNSIDQQGPTHRARPQFVGRGSLPAHRRPHGWRRYPLPGCRQRPGFLLQAQEYVRTAH